MKVFIIICCFVPLLLLVFFLIPKPVDLLQKPPFNESKVNGVSLVSPHQPVDAAEIVTVKRINSNWVAIIPYGFSIQNEPEIFYNTRRQWWGERTEGVASLIKMAKANNLKVMLKPHVWLRQKWIGDFDLDSEEKWQKWQQEYTTYVMTFARLADSMQVELFCMGTEYKIATARCPDYWTELISKIRKNYKGPLTYAANWDNFQNIPFWDQLDYIGIDAYFPLVQLPDPSAGEIRKAWVPVRERIQAFSFKYNKPILFTEYGYQSADGATGKPWEVRKGAGGPNLELQARAYDCLFYMFWGEHWFAGGFLWKWHLQQGAGGLQNQDFTPQGKPAEQIIANWYDPSLAPAY